MNYHSLFPFLSSIVFLGLGFFVFLNGPKSRLNISYSLWALMTAWWQGSWAVLFTVSDPTLADFLVKVGYTGITFLPITYYHFVVEFLGIKEKKLWVLSSYGIGAVFVLLLWKTNFYINGFYSYPWGYYPKAGILHPVFLGFLSYLAFQGFYLPYEYGKRNIDKPFRYNQIRYVFFGNIIYGLAAMDFMNNYGFRAYPLGFVPIFISSIIFSYAIYRYKLMDINLVFRYAAIYSIFACLVGAPVALAGWMIQSWLFSTIMGLCAIFASPWLFSKLRQSLTSTVDRLPLFKGRYEKLSNLRRRQNSIAEAKSVE